MKIAIVLLLCLVLALANVNSVAGQTFQYSRGWTNGRKRSDDSRRTAEVLARRLFPFAKRLDELAAVVEEPLGPGNCKYSKTCMDNDDRPISERDLVRSLEFPLLNNVAEFDHRTGD